MLEVVVFLYVGLALSYLTISARGRLLMNPSALFVFAQLVMFLGTLPLLKPSEDPDRTYIWVMFGFLITFICGATVVDFLRPVGKRRVGRWWSQETRVETGVSFDLAIATVAALSVAVTAAYYAAVGYNLFLNALLALATGQGPLGDITALRLLAYSGDRYFAPGYVNQFKNILLPLTTAFLAARYVLQRTRKDLLAVTVLAPIAVFGLLGTGQRGAFIIASLAVLIFVNASLPRRLARRLTASGTIAVLVLFLTTTLFLGRSVKGVESARDIVTLGAEIARRITHDNQLSGLVGFRHVYGEPVQYGREWLTDFAGLLPTRTGSRLPHELHRILYGSERGTAPVSLCGSIWYNFGPVGIILVPFLLGFAYQALYIRLLRGPKTLFRLLLFSGATVVLGTWIGGTPMSLINAGLVAVILLGAAVNTWTGCVRGLVSHKCRSTPLSQPILR